MVKNFKYWIQRVISNIHVDARQLSLTTNLTKINNGVIKISAIIGI